MLQMKIPTKRKIINSFLEDNYLGKNIKVYVGRGIIGIGNIATNNVEPKYFHQICTNSKQFDSRINNPEQFVVKITRIEWNCGLSYRIIFDPIIYKDQTFIAAFIQGEFELV